MKDRCVCVCVCAYERERERVILMFALLFRVAVVMETSPMSREKTKQRTKMMH